MNVLGITVVLVGLVGAWAQINVLHPQCDSPEVEEAALVAQDYLNGQHEHGYKYALNRIEDVKVYPQPDGNNTYVLEVDLLETDCHVLDPTPVANCTVRSKHLTAVEGDCDVVLKTVGGVLTVVAFKCKTEESREDVCLGCPTLLPLNDTIALDFVHTSLATFNNRTDNVSYTVQEVGRLSSQVVSGGRIYLAEYVVVEANCIDDACVPLNDTAAVRGFCSARGLNADHSVDCKLFPTLVSAADANSTVTEAVPPAVYVHTGNLPHKHGLRHHKLTAHHDPDLSGLVSAESAESAEVVPVVPAVVPAADPVADPAADPATIAPAVEPAPASDSGSNSASSEAAENPRSKEIPFHFRKRDVSAVSVADIPAQTDLVSLVPPCPGRIRYF